MIWFGRSHGFNTGQICLFRNEIRKMDYMKKLEISENYKLKAFDVNILILSIKIITTFSQMSLL